MCTYIVYTVDIFRMLEVCPCSGVDVKCLSSYIVDGPSLRFLTTFIGQGSNLVVQKW